MSGNVGEWEDACTRFDNAAELQNCLSRGGSWYEGEDRLRCDAFRDIPRYSMGEGVGFRCCAGPG
jgi:formylglycine-generating enzyme required for sulfatase activity